MTPEHVRAPAVIGERGQRFDRLVLALPGAEIAFQSPECGDHRSWDAELLLFASKQCLILLDVRDAAGQASVAQHLVGYLNEVLGEETLAAVDIDDALIEHEIG